MKAKLIKFQCSNKHDDMERIDRFHSESINQRIHQEIENKAQALNKKNKILFDKVMLDKMLEFDTQLEKAKDELKEEMVGFTLSMLEKLLIELPNKVKIKNIILMMVSQYEPSTHGKINLVVHPSEQYIAEEILRDIDTASSLARHIVIISSSEIKQGECLFQNKFYTMTYNLAHQLALIKKKIGTNNVGV